MRLFLLALPMAGFVCPIVHANVVHINDSESWNFSFVTPIFDDNCEGCGASASASPTFMFPLDDLPIGASVNSATVILEHSTTVAFNGYFDRCGGFLANAGGSVILHDDVANQWCNVPAGAGYLDRT